MRYTWEVVDKPFTEKAEDCRIFDREKTVIVEFLDENSTVIETKEYGYITEDEVLSQQNQNINLNRLFVESLNLSKKSFEYISAYDALINTSNFSEIKIAKGCHFNSVRFGVGGIDFSGSEFGEGTVDFSGAVFGAGDVTFAYANFGDGDVTFSHTELIEGDVDFSYSVFGKGNIVFGGTQFGAGNLDFIESDFGDGNIEFIHTHFGEGDVLFSSIEMGTGNIDVLNVTVDGLMVYDSRLIGHHSFKFDNCHSLAIIDCLIDGTLELSCDHVKALNLFNTKNLGQIFLDWEDGHVGDAIGKNEEATNEDKVYSFKLLKQNYDTIGAYEFADKAYVKFKEYEALMKLEACYSGNFFKKTIGLTKFITQKICLDWVGGYGTKLRTILLTILWIYIIFVGIYSMACDETLNHLMIHSAMTLFSIGSGYVAQMNDIMAVLSIIEGLLGKGLMLYFLAALVRKIVR